MWDRLGYSEEAAGKWTDESVRAHIPRLSAHSALTLVWCEQVQNEGGIGK